MKLIETRFQNLSENDIARIVRSIIIRRNNIERDFDALSAILNKALEDKVVPFLADGDLLNNLAFDFDILNSVTQVTLHYNWCGHNVYSLFILRDIYSSLEEIDYKINRVTTSISKESICLDSSHIESCKLLMDYVVENDEKIKPQKGLIEVVRTLPKLCSAQQAANGLIFHSLSLAIHDICKSLSDALDYTFSDEETVQLIKNSTQRYALINDDVETERLKKQTRHLFSTWPRELTTEHWGKMKQTEDKALKLAAEGLLSTATDDSYSDYSESDRKLMDSHSEMIKQLIDCFPDDELFDFDIMCDYKHCDLLKAIHYTNLELFFRLIHRGNIIRCMLYPNLRPQFEAWLLGKEVETEPDTVNKKTDGPLDTDKAMALWHKLQEGGIVDENFMPIEQSGCKAAIVANRMMEKLDTTVPWSEYETRWNIANLANKLVRAREATYFPEYDSKIKNILK